MLPKVLVAGLPKALRRAVWRLAILDGAAAAASGACGIPGQAGWIVYVSKSTNIEIGRDVPLHVPADAESSTVTMMLGAVCPASLVEWAKSNGPANAAYGKTMARSADVPLFLRSCSW